MRFVWTTIAFMVTLAIVVPLVKQLVNVLFVPVIVCVVLYLIVRLVNVWAERW